MVPETRLQHISFIYIIPKGPRNLNDLSLFLFTLNVAESSGIEKPLLKTSRKWLLATMNE